MKVWEKYYQKGLHSMSWMGKKWRTMWEEKVVEREGGIMNYVIIDEERMKNIIEAIGRFINGVDGSWKDAHSALEVLRDEYDRQIVNYKPLPEKEWWSK